MDGVAIHISIFLGNRLGIFMGWVEDKQTQWYEVTYKNEYFFFCFFLQSCCRIFDASTAESIQDLCRKSLRRLATQQEEPDELETCFSSVDQGWRQLIEQNMNQ